VLERDPTPTERKATTKAGGIPMPHGRRAAASIAGSPPRLERDEVKPAGTESESPGQAVHRNIGSSVRFFAPADATGKTSKGNEAHGRSGSRDSGNGARETPDPPAEQRLEADERQGGNGRGDAKRLQVGRLLRRV